jgi:hypothetical protein
MTDAITKLLYDTIENNVAGEMNEDTGLALVNVDALAEAVLARHPLTILQMLELETMKHELRRAMGEKL